MRILITGGCGFLGAHLIEHFLRTTDADTEILVLDKLTYASNGYDRLRDISRNLPGGLPDRVKVFGCDLAQPIPEGVVQEVGAVDYVIHAAAESHVDRSIIDPMPFLRSNVIGTHHLLWSPIARGAKRVFIVSTDEVYGPLPLDPPDFYEEFGSDAAADAHAFGFDENARYRPANPYAASKAGAEAIAMAYANTYRMPITIVNTMNLIGERQHPEKFVPMVIRKILTGDEVTIHADQSCTKSGTRFYLHCRTFANALGWLMERSPVLGARMPLKIHVCGEREISNLSLAHMILDCLVASLAAAGGNKLTLKYKLVDFHSSRPGHDLRYAMCDEQIRTMGWIRPMNLEDSLKKTVAWYLDNPKWLTLT